MTRRITPIQEPAKTPFERMRHDEDMKPYNNINSWTSLAARETLLIGFVMFYLQASIVFQFHNMLILQPPPMSMCELIEDTAVADVLLAVAFIVILDIVLVVVGMSMISIYLCYLLE